MSIHTKAIILAMLAAGPASALADISFYAGFGAGGSRLEEDLNITLTAFDYQGPPGQEVLTPIASSSLDKFKGTDVGYRVFAGVKFWRFLGIEAGYVSLGEPDESLGVIIPPDAPLRPEIAAALKLTDEIDGIEAYAVGYLPFSDKWEAFAKLGVIDWDSTFKTRNAFSDVYPPSPPPSQGGQNQIPTVTPPSSTVDTDGTDLAGGIGLNYKAAEHMTIRGEGTWYDIENTELAWLLNFSLIYDF